MPVTTREWTLRMRPSARTDRAPASRRRATGSPGPADAIFGAAGRWSVRLRWLVVLVWAAGAIAAVTQLPALSSVTQSSNAKFLPASAPSQHAIGLAAPFGNASLLPIPIIAATTSGPLTPADAAALTRMTAKIAAYPDIKQVKD